MHELIVRMADDLTLVRGTEEGVKDYERRVLWSALGRMMSASLFDRSIVADSDSRVGETSVIHFRRRIAHLVEAYDAMFPQIGFAVALMEDVRKNAKESLSFQDVAERIDADARANGMAYHRSQHLLPPRAERQAAGDIVFVRGLPPGVRVLVSGFGAYQRAEVQGTSTEGVRSMFQLDAPLDVSVLDRLAARGTFRVAAQGRHAEYLRTDGAFQKGYWKAHPAPGLTIVRERMPYGPGRFYFCRTPQGGREEWMALPEAYVDDWGWIAHLVLLRAGTLPPIRFQRAGAIVHIACGYRLPAREQRFLRFYSWPEPGASGWRSATERVMSATLFDGWQELFKALGFSFLEEMSS